MSNLLGIFSSLKEFITLLIILIVAITIFTILFKFKNGKWFLLGLCGLALLVCGVFTAYANYEYFTIKGGTLGSFGDIFENKNKLMQNELKFDFENFVLIASGNNDNEFSARLAIDAVNQKMTDKTIFVNDIPTKTINRGDNYIFSEYNYTFYDENLKEKCSDTLTIKFVFNSKSSECILTTQGGIDKVAHWNYFLKKNNFIVEIKKYDYIQDTELKVDDEINHTLTLYFEDELIDIIEFNITSPATLPTTYNGFAITAWKDADGNVFTQSNLPNQDLTLYATISQTKTFFEINSTNLVRTFITDESSKRYTCKFVGASYTPKIYDDFYDLLYQNPNNHFNVKLNLYDFLGENLSFNSNDKGNYGSHNSSQPISFFNYLVSTGKTEYYEGSNEFYYTFTFCIERRKVNSDYIFTPYIDVEIVCATGDWSDKYNFVKEDTANNTMSFSVTCEINRV